MRVEGEVAGLFGDSFGPLLFGKESRMFSTLPLLAMLPASPVAWGRGR